MAMAIATADQPYETDNSPEEDKLRTSQAELIQVLAEDSIATSSHENRGLLKNASRAAVYRILTQCFILQVRYGCDDENCTKRTCFSFRKRFVATPVRRPTPLTARSQAFFLAATDDPLSRLCEADLRAWKDGEARVNIVKIREYIAWELEMSEPTGYAANLQMLEQKHSKEQNPQAHSKQLQITRQLDEVKNENGKPAGGLLPISNVDFAQQSAIDKSSITQKAFNTCSAREPFDCGFVEGRWHIETGLKLPLAHALLDASSHSHLRDSNGFTATLTGLTSLSRIYRDWPATDMLRRDRELRMRSQLTLFERRSVAFIMSDHARLLAAIRKNSLERPMRKATVDSDGMLVDLGARVELSAFSKLRDAGLVDQRDWMLQCLWHSLDSIFVPPPTIAAKLKGARRDFHLQYIQDLDCAQLLAAATTALPACLVEQSGETSSDKAGIWSYKEDPEEAHTPLGLRLAEKIACAITSRRTYWQIQRELRGRQKNEEADICPVAFMLFALFEDNSTTPSQILLPWLKSVFCNSWDGVSILKPGTKAGAALDLMADLHRYERHAKHPFGMHEDSFQLPALERHLMQHHIILEYSDLILPTNRGRDRWRQNHRHILDYPFLFTGIQRIKFFRLLLLHRMYLSHQSARAHKSLHLMFAWLSCGEMEYECNDAQCGHAMCERQRSRKWQAERWLWAGYERLGSRPLGNFWNRQAYLEKKLRRVQARYLVLNVRREALLEDAMDQLWGRERRELLKPLKIRMGVDGEGEEGVDHGGVAQEFFRLVFARAFDPAYGMFVVTDERSKMDWFKPLSPEPLQTFEFLGLLVGLAVYNGITVPLNFPIALYHVLARGEVSGENMPINDGWPTLNSSFDQLLAWDDGDVDDIFARDYAFSFEANGETYTIDLSDPSDFQHWPGPRAPIPPTWANTARSLQPVTNANRDRFVADYTNFLLTTSVQPQLSAFVRGFSHLVPPAHANLLTPSLLRTLVEGTRFLDLAALRLHTTYEDGYSAIHPTISLFWSVVLAYDQQDARRLLTFVTATDRCPVQGWQATRFSIVRWGAEQDRVPGSSTCFGKLLLPEYESREAMVRGLNVALENCVGFGNF